MTGIDKKDELTADYVRTHYVSSIVVEVERLIRNNPGPSLLAAAVMGFVIGRTWPVGD